MMQRQCMRCGKDTEKIVARGLCEPCYSRARYTSTMLDYPPMRNARMEKFCGECGIPLKRHAAKGMCKTCANKYYAARRTMAALENHSFLGVAQNLS